MSIMVNGTEVMMGHPGNTKDFDALMAALTSVPAGTTILEYGSGGSTKMFADRMGETNRLCSVEHNPEWYAKVRELVAGHPASKRISRLLAHLEFSHDRWKFAQPEEEMGAGAKYYIWAPEQLPDWQWSKVGLVLVDGIARGPCLAYLRTRLNPGTLVFLHDYTGRENWYDWAANLFDRVALHDLTIEMRVPIDGRIVGGTGC